MPTFQSSEEAAKVIGGFLGEIMADPDLGPKFAKAEAKVLLTYTDPDVRFLMDCTANPPQLEVEPAEASDVSFKLQMSTDNAHQFWLGKLNLPMALAKRQVKTEGPLTKMMGLLPAIQPAFARYNEYLKTNYPSLAG